MVKFEKLLMIFFGIIVSNQADEVMIMELERNEDGSLKIGPDGDFIEKKPKEKQPEIKCNPALQTCKGNTSPKNKCTN